MTLTPDDLAALRDTAALAHLNSELDAFLDDPDQAGRARHERPPYWWLTGKFTDKAKYHATPVCTGLRWAIERAGGDPDALYDMLAAVRADLVDEFSEQRTFCRLCALEGVMVRAITTEHPRGRDVTVTIAAAAAGREPSESAVARLHAIAAATGMSVATGGKPAAVLYGIVPVHAAEVAERNFVVSYPPPDLHGLVLDSDVVTTAWSIPRRLDDDAWRVAAAACL